MKLLVSFTFPTIYYKCVVQHIIKLLFQFPAASTVAKYILSCYTPFETLVLVDVTLRHV